MLPAIYEAVKKTAPSGIMSAGGVRLLGVELLTQNLIEEGIPLCLVAMDYDDWGKGTRIARSLRALAQYGGAAKSELPQLREIEKDLSKSRPSTQQKSRLELVRNVIRKIEGAKKAPELRPM